MNRTRIYLLAGAAVIAVVALLGAKRCSGGSSGAAGDADESGAAAEDTGDPWARRGGDPGASRLAAGRSAAPATVSGYVLDAASGEPVPYVDVLFRRAGAEETANSGDSGAFQIDLPGGAYQVRAVGDGLVGVPQPEIFVAGRPLRVDVRVQRLAHVSGRVVDHEGNGVGGAEVTWIPRTAADKLLAGSVPSGTAADGGGSFALDVVAGGDVILEASSEGRRGRAVVTAVAPGSDRSGVVIELDPGATVRGVVYDPGGSPVAGATVSVAVRTTTGIDHREQVDTGSGGGFRVGPVPTGTAVLEAFADGFAQSAPQRVTLVAGEETLAELHLQRPRILAGRVVDGDGKPVAGARVRAGRGGSKVKALEVYTGGDGGFSFDEVDRGPYWVSAVADGYAPATAEQVRTPAEDLELRLEANGGFRGTVSDSGGKPVTDFEIQVVRYRPLGVSSPRGGGAPKRHQADDGRFESWPHAPGTYDLDISASGYGTARMANVEVPPGDWAELSVTLTRGGTITGRVTSAETGEPVAMARVTAALGAAKAPVFTDASGRFTLDEVSAGRRSIVVTHPGYAALTRGGLDVDAGETTEVDVRLTPRSPNRSAEISGVGLVVDQRNDELFVRTVVKDGPAARAGVKKGDVFVRVDGAAVSGMGRDALVDRLRGEPGTKVTIEVRRGGRTVEITITRERLTAPSTSHGAAA